MAGKAPNAGSVTGGLAAKDANTPGPGAKQKYATRTPVKDLTDEFTPHDKVTLNSDGTRTIHHSLGVSQYKSSDGAWHDVNTTLRQTSFVPIVYQTMANSWTATFAPAGQNGGITLSDSASSITFGPATSKLVDPVLTTEGSQQLVIYHNVWPGVDLEYAVTSTDVTETLIVNRPHTATSFDFNLAGAALNAEPTRPGWYTVTGALSNRYVIAAPALATNTDGVIGDVPYVSQSVNGSRLTVTLNSDWAAQQPADAYPLRIDPTFTDPVNSSYVNYKSDGYVCAAGQGCGNSVGTSGGKYWRFVTPVSFPQSVFQGKYIVSANMHLEMPSCGNSYGICDATGTYVDWASCYGYNCVNGSFGEGYAWFTTAGYVDVTNLFRNLQAVGGWNPSVIVRGMEVTWNTYKLFAYDRTWIDFVYDTQPPVATPSGAAPGDGATVVTTQPSLSVNPVTDAEGDQVQYYYRVSTNPDAETGAVVNSGWTTAPQWTVPDGVLQDGTTYYWHVYTWDGWSNVPNTVPNWVRKFQVNLRNGKDATQAQDSFGGVSVDLATGNLSTGAATHSEAALGGSLGVGLTYNSPVRSRPGLVAQYWNDTAHNSTFTGNPLVTRVEPNVNISWGSGSPDPAITSDYFLGRWSGYFVAPRTATYQFGVTADDIARIYVGGNLVTNSWSTTLPSGYYGSNVALTAGQVVPIQIDYGEWITSAAMYALVKTTDGTIAPQVIPTAWLQTGPQQASAAHGLVGRYFNDPGNHVFPADNTAFMVRTDPAVNFYWGSGSPMAGGPVDNFMARWTGYFTAPVNGAYTFGTNADDGTRLTINGTQTFNNWSDTPGQFYGSAVNLSAGQTVPITMEYYEHGGSAAANLMVKGAVAEQVVPASWLLPKVQAVPDGWSLSESADGSLSYDHLTVNQNSVTLTDAAGSTHEYAWTGTGYKPPVGEDGQLARNNDGTLTLQDSDGRSYIFNPDGSLKSATTAPDDRNPAALQYAYAGTPSHLGQITDGANSSRWMKLYYGSDANCPSIPSGYTNPTPANMICAAATNDGNVTQFLYLTDASGAPRLARIVKPGNAATDYGYDTLGRIVQIRSEVANDAVAAGVRTADGGETTQITYDSIGRANSVTLPAANAGDTRQAHTYDFKPALSPALAYTNVHVVGAAEPNGFSRQVTYDDTFRTATDSDAANLTTATAWDPVKDQVLSTTDPTGLMSTTLYDNDNRVTDQYGPAPAAWFGSDRKPTTSYVNQVPHSQSGYDESITGPAVTYMAVNAPAANDTLANNQTMTPGQSRQSADHRFTFAYQTDGNLVLYGPNGVMWASNTGGRATTYLVMQTDGNLVLYNGGTPVWASNTGGGNTAHLAVQNDGNVVIYTSGGATWSTVTGGWAGINYGFSNLTGAPLLHATNIGGNAAQVNRDFGTGSPATGVPATNWGMTLTGKLRLPASGNYTIRLASDSGARMWIDDQLVISDWYDGGYRSHPSYVFANTANSLHRVRIDYYHLGGDANFGLFMTPPGGSETANVAGYFDPDYSLPTSNKVFDAQLGDITTASNYGSNPELGLLQSSSVTGGSLTYGSSSTYEAQGASGSYLRQTSQTLPGGNSYTYAYYGATETRVNPCNAGQTFMQAGLGKTRTDPDPDGAGPLTARTTEVVRDDGGRIVASRTNADPWTCTTYDSRGRVAQVIQPDVNGRAGRTITYNYAVGGNPLVGSKTDSVAGTTTVTTDLLGRLASGTDTFGYVTSVSYDSLGRVSQQVSLKGTEVPTYDNLSRVTSYALDGTTYATLTYDAYGRVATVTYPQAQTGGTKLTLSQISRDSLQRVTGSTFTFSDNSTMTEAITLSPQRGIVTADSVTQGGHTAGASYQYDGIGRLTQATVDNWQYQYAFGTQDSSCTSLPGYNASANKNGNRTSSTVTNTLTSTSTTTLNCYNQADQLSLSSDLQVGAPAYDDHGNITQLAGAGTPIQFTYDAADHNTAIQQGTNSVQYTKDAGGTVLVKKEYRGGNLDKVYRNASGVLLSCDVNNQTSCTTLDKYVNLPGGVTLTMTGGTPVYSIHNFHGDTAITVGAAGTPTSSVFLYDPFGQVLVSNTFGTGTAGPANSSVNPMGWAASPSREMESLFTLPIIQMGTRTYLPTLGRFTSVDPVLGGTDNAYSYVNDPVNENDYSGQFSLGGLISSVAKAVVKAVVAVAKVIVPAPVQHLVKTVIAPAARAIVKVVAAKTASTNSSGRSSSGSNVVGAAQELLSTNGAQQVGHLGINSLVGGGAVAATACAIAEPCGLGLAGGAAIVGGLMATGTVAHYLLGQFSDNAKFNQDPAYWAGRAATSAGMGVGCAAFVGEGCATFILKGLINLFLGYEPSSPLEPVDKRTYYA